MKDVARKKEINSLRLSPLDLSLSAGPASARMKTLTAAGLLLTNYSSFVAI